MPSWGVHIAIANRLNKKLKLGSDFIIGNVLPDASNGIIVKGISNVIDHATTHYNFQGSNRPPKNDVDKFLEVYKNNLNNSLILGSLIHIMTDNYFNTYTRDNHIDTINEKNVAILNDGSILSDIIPWKLKQEEFRKFADYLIYNKKLGKTITITKDTLNLEDQLVYHLSLYDLILIINKINSVIEKDVSLKQDYKMFSLEELITLYDNCNNYLDKEIENIQKKKIFERR